MAAAAWLALPHPAAVCFARAGRTTGGGGHRRAAGRRVRQGVWRAHGGSAGLGGRGWGEAVEGDRGADEGHSEQRGERHGPPVDEQLPPAAPRTPTHARGSRGAASTQPAARGPMRADRPRARYGAVMPPVHPPPPPESSNRRQRTGCAVAVGRQSLPAQCGVGLACERVGTWRWAVRRMPTTTAKPLRTPPASFVTCTRVRATQPHPSHAESPQSYPSRSSGST